MPYNSSLNLEMYKPKLLKDRSKLEIKLRILKTRVVGGDRLKNRQWIISIEYAQSLYVLNGKVIRNLMLNCNL